MAPKRLDRLRFILSIFAICGVVQLTTALRSPDKSHIFRKRELFHDNNVIHSQNEYTYAQPEETLSFTHSDYRLPHKVNVAQYDVYIHPFFDAAGVTYNAARNQTFDGRVVMHFQVTNILPHFNLNTENLTIFYVKLLRNGVKQELVSSGIHSDITVMRVIPTIPFAPGINYTLETHYTGIIRQAASLGLYRSTYWAPDGGQSDVYLTFFEENGARRVFPCLDDPHFKAVFNLTVVRPQSLTVLANTIENEGVDIGNGYNAVTFPLTPRMSSYLVAFAIGNFTGLNQTAYDGLLVRAWTWKSTEQELPSALKPSVLCAEAMTNYTNYHLPLKKLDNIAVPTFPAGAMENWGDSIYAANTLLHDPKLAPIGNLFENIYVICHETTHQWFGDLVTNDWWGDIMLHESFATFLPNYDMSWGYPAEQVFVDNYYVSTIRTSGLAFHGRNEHPWITENGSFDSITYNRGATFLRMISETLTAPVFRYGLQLYLTKYALSTATHQDLIAELNSAVQLLRPNVSDWCGNQPLNVQAFTQSWLTVPLYPQLSVSYNEDIVPGYIIRQEPFYPASSLPSGYTYQWQVPFFVNGVQYWSNTLACPQGFQSFDGTVAVPINPDAPYPPVDPQATTAVRIHYHENVFAQLLKTITNSSITSVTSATLIRFINDELAIVERDRFLQRPASISRVVRLVNAVAKRNTSITADVFVAAAGLFDRVYNLLVDSNERTLIDPYFTNIIQQFNTPEAWNVSEFQFGTWNQVFYRVALQWDLPGIESALQPYFTQINTCANANTVNDYYNCLTIDANIRSNVYCAYVKVGGSPNFNTLLKLLSLSRKIVAAANYDPGAIVSGLACSDDPAVINLFLESLFDPTTALNPQIDARALRSNNKAGDVILQFISANLDKVRNSSISIVSLLGVQSDRWFTPARIQKLQRWISQITPQLIDYELTQINLWYQSLVNNAPNLIAQYLDVVKVINDLIIPTGYNPWPWRLPTTVSAEQYDLSLFVYVPNQKHEYLPERNFTYDANITAHLTITNATSSITLNAHRMAIWSFEASRITGNQNVPLTIVNVANNYTEAFITLTFNESLPAGTNVTVSFSYAGFIFDHGRDGFSANDINLQNQTLRSYVIFTVFEGGPSARSLAICLDEPVYKARWNVTLIYAAEFEALFNALEVTTTTLTSSNDSTPLLVQRTYQLTPPMSSYLLAVAIGHYSSIETKNAQGLPVRIWSWTGSEQYGQFALDVAVKTINFLTSTLNVTQPLSKFDYLALPQFTGRGSGALENWGLVFAGYKEVLFHPNNSRTSDLINIQSVVSHELTHHWFGDLVTMYWWNDLFLNEGFATYWPPRILEAIYPQQKPLADLRIFNIHEGAYSTLREVIPDNSDLETGNWPLFGNAVYGKAESVIDTLANAFGRNYQSFILALHNYLQKHALATATDADLWQSFQEQTTANNITGWSGTPLNVLTFATPYTKNYGYPIINVTKTATGLQLTQIPSVPNPPGNKTIQPWYVPFYIEDTQLGSDAQLHWIVGNEPLTLNTQNLSVLVNQRSRTFARVLYDDASWSNIQSGLSASSYDDISRVQLLADSWAFLKSENITWTRFLDTTKFLINETSPIVWSSLSQDSSFIFYLIEGFRYQPNYASILQYLTTITAPVSPRNFSLTGNWVHDTAYSALAELRCYLGDRNCLQLSLVYFLQFASSCGNSLQSSVCNSVPPDYRPAQYCYGLQSAPQEYSTMYNLHQLWTLSPSYEKYFPTDAQYIEESLGCVTEPSLIQTTLNLFVQGVLSGRVLEAIMTFDTSGSILLNFAKSNFPVIRSLPILTFEEYIYATFYDWSTDDQLKEYNSFVATYSPQLSNSQTNILERIGASITTKQAFIAQHGKEISEWVSKFNG